MSLADLAENGIFLGIILVVASTLGLFLEFAEPDLLENIALAGTGLIFLSILLIIIGN